MVRACAMTGRREPIELVHLLRELRAASARPRWLDVTPNARIEPEHLFWPETRAGEALLQQVNSQSLLIACPGADIRLAIDQDDTEALGALTIQPDGLPVAGIDGTFSIDVEVGQPTQGVNATYAFKPDGEALKLAEGTTADPRPITLAMPLIATAQTLRKASGLPEPRPAAPPTA